MKILHLGYGDDGNKDTSGNQMVSLVEVNVTEPIFLSEHFTQFRVLNRVLKRSERIFKRSERIFKHLKPII